MCAQAIRVFCRLASWKVPRSGKCARREDEPDKLVFYRRCLAVKRFIGLDISVQLCSLLLLVLDRVLL